MTLIWKLPSVKFSTNYWDLYFGLGVIFSRCSNRTAFILDSQLGSLSGGDPSLFIIVPSSYFFLYLMLNGFDLSTHGVILSTFERKNGFAVPHFHCWTHFLLYQMEKDITVHVCMIFRAFIALLPMKANRTKQASFCKAQVGENRVRDVTGRKSVIRFDPFEYPNQTS